MTGVLLLLAAVLAALSGFLVRLLTLLAALSGLLVRLLVLLAALVLILIIIVHNYLQFFGEVFACMSSLKQLPLAKPECRQCQ
jgi:hypothetical protein